MTSMTKRVPTFVALLALWLTGACASPIVGAECAEGYSECDGRCVDLTNDGENCGACGVACIDGLCVDGVCPAGPIVDGGSGEDGGPIGDGGVADADMGGARDGSMDDGGSPDLGPPPECACNLGETCCDTACVDLDTALSDCGACGNACASDEVCSAGTCRPMCDPGLTLCGGLCLDLETDPNNCGACGNVCASGICIAGACAIGFPGHVVLVGHDYQVNREGQNRVGGNAVFTSFAPAPRVAVYVGDAPMRLVRGVDRAIDQVATERGRSWTRTVVDASEVSSALDDAEVFLIYPQGDGATDGELLDLGALWSVALDTYTRRGGVVVVFDGAASHSGTWQILSSATLLDVDGRVEVTGDELMLSDPSDTVAFGVPLRYAGEETTVRFTDTDGAQSVVADTEGPVVLHRTVVP